ncbi:transcriptional regulator, LysR family [Roseateles sp. YR242]|uniref:LysR substrate-binding domain-containing protein n=1 Tax=Roseateles sp. YR242 TaxID=1855305 RepID=UPI0008CB6A3D|nr:LysR substrate-binding domain-containing protein [Roseateles sp. YR242]SEK62081.1 transcriptional regulator, LysR family [Roseateles sp. YR242]
MTMNLTWIDDFMALAASGNFSRAAEERHMTQPAFSRRIRALEEWLGVDLFDRNTQPARVTPAGEWFRKAAQDLQAHVTRVPLEARAVAEASSRTLRLAATHALSFTFLPRWLHTLEQRLPVGPVQLDSDVHEKCEALLLKGQVQFVLTHGHASVRGALDEAGYPFAVLGSDRLLPVSAPDAGGAPMHRLVEDTVGGVEVAGKLLTYGFESGIGRLLRELKGAPYARLAAQAGMTAQLASVLRTMAMDGRGLAWLPEILVSSDLASGRLVLAAGPAWTIDLALRLYRDRGALGEAADAFWAAASQATG